MKKIAYITDLHLDEKFTLDNGVDARKNWMFVLSDVKVRGITDIIFGGDIGDKTSNEWFFETLKDYELNITLGNHDSFEEAVKYYNPDLPEDQIGMYYSIEDDYYKFIFLDTSTDEVSLAQLDWLLNELKTERKILLFSHHPILDTGTTPQREFPWKSDSALREVLFQLHTEIFVFCGHLHLDDEKTEKNITQYVTRSTSIQIKRDTKTTEIGGIDFGYRILKLGQNELKSEVITFGLGLLREQILKPEG